jgi:peptidoglycan-N-acetylglucosamine deacetylase
MERNGGPRSTLGGSIVAGIAVAGVAWAARGRASTVFGPSVWRGSADRREIALTFDDGPSPSTPRLLRVLEQQGVPATFFQCGMHVRRFPQVTREVALAGHEMGNHTDTHPRIWFKS